MTNQTKVKPGAYGYLTVTSERPNPEKVNLNLL